MRKVGGREGGEGGRNWAGCGESGGECVFGIRELEWSGGEVSGAG